MSSIAPAIFLNHGGGARPLLDDEDHTDLIEFFRNGLKKFVNVKNYKAVILVTAHWEEDIVSISSGDHHDLYFDYYEYPPEAYTYKYNAPGSPELAGRIHEKLEKAGIKTRLDPYRGWDHGLFVPMMLINPDADIPIVQVSVMTNQDAKKHYELGQALQQFREEGIPILGSGMSYHNFKEIKSGVYKREIVNKDFDDYLNDVCTADIEKKRREGLCNWKAQLGAIEAHPANCAEHLMPLMVIAGAGGTAQGERVFKWDMFDTFRLSFFYWKDL